MSKETVITCPKCDGACFATTITSKPSSNSTMRPDTCDDCRRTVEGKQSCCPFHFNDSYNPVNVDHCMVLTCQRCNTALQFVVDLAPSFDRTESACAAIR
jgi:hypothetical protein